MGSRTKRRAKRGTSKSTRTVHVLVAPKGRSAITSGTEYTIKILVSDSKRPDLASELQHRIPTWVDLWGSGHVRASVTRRRVGA